MRLSLLQLARNRKGAALVEYAMLVAGVSLIGAAAVSTFGHKTTDLIATTAAVLPGMHTDDNGPIQSGHLIETAVNTNGAIALDSAAIVANSNTSRLGANTGLNDGTAANQDDLVTETGATTTP